MSVAEQETRRGLLITALTFALWGVVPVYWHLLKAVPSAYIIAHRIVWSAVLVVGWLLYSARFQWWRRIAALTGTSALPAALVGQVFQGLETLT